MRLIDADALLERAIPMGWSTPLWVSDITIKDAPTVNVIERKKGEWIIEKRKRGKWIIKKMNTYELSCGTTAYEPVYMCSVCERLTESYLRLDEPIMPEDADFPRFCPWCGAELEVPKDV